MTDRPNEPQTGTPVCYRHSDRATRLTCSKCGRPICAECSIDAAVGHRCPDCVRREGTTRVVRGRNVLANPSFDTSPVSFSIIAITVAMYLAIRFGLGVLLELEFNTVGLRNGEWWRALSVTLLHYDFFHILFNMYALYILGPRLEQQVGSAPFLSMWLASAAGGSAFAFFLGPESRAVGASGAIFGLFGAWVYVSWLQRHTRAGRAQLQSFIWLFVLNAALPIIFPIIDWRAHLGGFITGIVVAGLWRAFAAGKTNIVARRTVLATLVLAGLMALIILG